MSASDQVIQKRFVKGQELIYKSCCLGKQILEYLRGLPVDEDRKIYIVGIWRGGAPIGLYVQSFLEKHGLKTDHIAIRTSGYRKINDAEQTVAVHNLGYLVKNINDGDILIAVDDVFDRGKSMQRIYEELKRKTRKNFPKEFKVAVLFAKPEKYDSEVTVRPHFVITYVSGDIWLVFPHEFVDMTAEDLLAIHGKEVAALFEN